MSATPSPQTRMAPTYAKGHTRNIHRCTIFARPAPWVFHTTPRGGFRPPPGTEHPPGCLQAPLGVVSDAPPGTNHPRVRVAHCPGVDRLQDARATMSATR